MGLTRLVAIAFLIVIALAMGSGWLDFNPRGGRAATLAERYLAHLQSQHPDYGYSVIHRPHWGAWSYEQYEDAVTSADWSDFSARVTEVRYCDDGFCTVCLDVPGGIGSVPPFLRASENRASDGIIFPAQADDCGNAELWVVTGLLPGSPTGVSVGPKR